MLNSTSCLDIQVNSDNFTSKIASFFSIFGIATIARKSNIHKKKGIKVIDILMAIFTVVFKKSNIYRMCCVDKEIEIGKDAIYDFVNNYKFNWRNFLLAISTKIYEFINGLTSKSRDTVLIFDDTTYKRNRSKNVELLSNLYDHAKHSYYRGFRILTLVWSDGHSTIPVDFSALASSNSDNILCEQNKGIDVRSNGGKRREEAKRTIPDVILDMFNRAVEAGITAKYLVFDCWFTVSTIMKKFEGKIDIIGKVRKNANTRYLYNNQWVTINEIYQSIKKRPGLSLWLAAPVVKMKNDVKVKLVFARNVHNKKDWHVLASTNTRLSPDTIIRVYGKRWDIEVVFRTIKQHLCFETGTQSCNFDAIIAHITMSFLRYLFLSYTQRKETDIRTHGLLFHSCVDEVRDCDILTSYCRIINRTLDEIRKSIKNNLYDKLALAILLITIEEAVTAKPVLTSELHDLSCNIKRLLDD